jgi:hypothetical protein
MALPPCAPSDPIPVSTTARIPPRQISAADKEQRIDRRFTEIDLRPVIKGDHRTRGGARHTHVTATWSQIDCSSLDRLTVNRLVRRAPARTRQMLGENRRECRRHMLRNQNGILIDHRANARNEIHQCLWAAGG